MAKGNLIIPRRNSTTGCSLKSYPGLIMIIMMIIIIIVITIIITIITIIFISITKFHHCFCHILLLQCSSSSRLRK